MEVQAKPYNRTPGQDDSKIYNWSFELPEGGKPPCNYHQENILLNKKVILEIATN
jgi:hypothetical protein